MNNPKYAFTGKTKTHFGRTLHRIKRIADGLIGGWIESEYNLSHEGNCFVFDEAKVFGNAIVLGNVQVRGSAQVYGNAEVRGNALLSGNCFVCGDAEVSGKTPVCGHSEIIKSVEVTKQASTFSFSVVPEKYVITKNGVTIELTESELKQIA